MLLEKWPHLISAQADALMLQGQVSDQFLFLSTACVFSPSSPNRLTTCVDNCTARFQPRSVTSIYSRRHYLEALTLEYDCCVQNQAALWFTTTILTLAYSEDR